MDDATPVAASGGTCNEAFTHPAAGVGVGTHALDVVATGPMRHGEPLDDLRRLVHLLGERTRASRPGRGAASRE